MRYAAAIVQYNGDIFLEKQIERLRKYVTLNMGDTLDIIVADNSDPARCNECHGGKANKNAAICSNNGAIYMPMEFREGDNSTHHAMALNHIYHNYRSNFNGLLFLDHDIFPFNKTDILVNLPGHTFVGLAQEKGGAKYLHPALLGINLDLMQQDLNFLPTGGLDTGGQLAPLINDGNTKWLSLQYRNEGNDTFYEIIGDEWMHFVKGSNWNGNPNHKKRLKYLFSELEKTSL